MTKKITFLTVIAALTFSSCGGAAATQAPVQEFALAEAPAATSAPAREAASAADAQAPRLVIRNANLSVVVTDPAAAVERISALAAESGGFVVGSNVYQASTDEAGKKIMQADITIRVRAERLDQALALIEALAVSGEAESKNVSGEDVTAQFTDLESRLKNLEIAEAQLQRIMDGATKTPDVLAVHNELVAIRDQIEQVRGQMQYYSEAAALSAISVNLIPDALSQPFEVGGWKAEGVARAALEALVRAFQGLATALIWGGLYLLPLGLVCGIPVALAVVGVRLVRRRAKKVTPAA